MRISCSCCHLPVISGYKWDSTFYKWGYKYLQLINGQNCGSSTRKQRLFRRGFQKTLWFWRLDQEWAIIYGNLQWSCCFTRPWPVQLTGFGLNFAHKTRKQHDHDPSIHSSHSPEMVPSPVLVSSPSTAPLENPTNLGKCQPLRSKTISKHQKMIESDIVHHYWSSPIGSMYAIYGNIYHQYTSNVSIYTIHGSYGSFKIVACHGFRMFFWGWLEPKCSEGMSSCLRATEARIPWRVPWPQRTRNPWILVHRDGGIFQGKLHAKRWKTRWKTRWKLGSWETFETWLTGKIQGNWWKLEISMLLFYLQPNWCFMYNDYGI